MLEILLFNFIKVAVALAFIYWWVRAGSEYLQWLPEQLAERVSSKNYDLAWSWGMALVLLALVVVAVDLGGSVAAVLTSWM